jgi:hypothetical protein
MRSMRQALRHPAKLSKARRAKVAETSVGGRFLQLLRGPGSARAEGSDGEGGQDDPLLFAPVGD